MAVDFAIGETPDAAARADVLQHGKVFVAEIGAKQGPSECCAIDAPFATQFGRVHVYGRLTTVGNLAHHHRDALVLGRLLDAEEDLRQAVVVPLPVQHAGGLTRRVGAIDDLHGQLLLERMAGDGAIDAGAHFGVLDGGGVGGISAGSQRQRSNG